MDNGYWWTATYQASASRYRIIYNSSDGKYHGSDYIGRSYGLFIRCVKSS